MIIRSITIIKGFKKRIGKKVYPDLIRLCELIMMACLITRPSATALAPPAKTTHPTHQIFGIMI